jgi:WD40 repeat protein
MRVYLLILFLLTTAIATSAEPVLEQIWEKEYPEKINSAKFSLDGQFIYGATDNTIKKISVETGEILSEFENEQVSGIGDFRISNLGNIIVTIDGTGGVNIWDVNQEKSIKYFDLESRSIDISPDEKYIAVGSMLEGLKYNDGIIIIYDYINDKEITRIHANSAVSKLKFSNDGRYLASGSVSINELSLEYESILTLWETENWTNVKELQKINSSHGYKYLKFSKNDEYLYFLNTNQAYVVKFIDLEFILNTESSRECSNIVILPDNTNILVQYIMVV